MRTWIPALIAAIIFFLIALSTVSDYGISWDEPTHFRRGLGYVHYFLTGKTNYDGMPVYNKDAARADKDYHERSLYQDNSYDLDYFLSDNHDWGHPPLNSIFAGFFNFVLYQKLGIVGDIESFHVFNIFVSALLVGVVFLWAAEVFGVWAGIFSSIFLSTYPLFFAESHFNIKDPAETAFFTITLYFFWKGLKSKKSIFIILSSIFAGFAMGTKFNILFAPLIFILWLIISHFGHKTEILKNVFSKKMLITLTISPFIMVGIFFATWPYLWKNTVERTISIFWYYKDIGTATHFQPEFVVGIFNTYPFQWILFTTQPLVILFFVLCFMTIKYYKKEQRDVLTLWMLWFVFTILRVSFSGTSIYGGVRQIMEYIPAMALIAGAGVEYFRNWIISLIKKSINVNSIIVSSTLVVILLTTSILTIIRLHPNENVYFNFLVGGLKDAVDRNIPAAGNSFGNAYWQGTQWLNKNVEKDAKLALIQGYAQNIPISMLRNDIQLSIQNRSGIDRGGEYLMELVFNYETKQFYYSWEYAQKMLEPVYDVKVDGVKILQIWKNDLEHTKREYQKKEIIYDKKMKVSQVNNSLKIDLPQEVLLSRLLIDSPTINCLANDTGFIRSSVDGKTWIREIDPFNKDQLGRNSKLNEGQFQYMFAARIAKYIEVNFGEGRSCELSNPKVELVILE